MLNSYRSTKEQQIEATSCCAQSSASQRYKPALSARVYDSAQQKHRASNQNLDSQTPQTAIKQQQSSPFQLNKAKLMVETSAKKKLQQLTTHLANKQSDVSTLFKDQTNTLNNEPRTSSSFVQSPASQSLQYRIYDVPKPYVPFNVSVKSPSNLGGPSGKKAQQNNGVA